MEEYGFGTGLVQLRQPDTYGRAWLRSGIDPDARGVRLRLGSGTAPDAGCLVTGPGLDQELIRMPEQYGSGTGLVQPRQPDACDRTWLRPGIDPDAGGVRLRHGSGTAPAAGCLVAGPGSVQELIRMPEEYGSGTGLVQLRYTALAWVW